MGMKRHEYKYQVFKLTQFFCAGVLLKTSKSHQGLVMLLILIIHISRKKIVRLM